MPKAGPSGLYSSPDLQWERLAFPRENNAERTLGPARLLPFYGPGLPPLSPPAIEANVGHQTKAIYEPG